MAEELEVQTEAAEVAALAWGAMAPTVIADEPAFVVEPVGAEIKALEAFGVKPWRPRASVTVADVASFTAYLERHGTRATVVFANDGGVSAVLNFRGPSEGLEDFELGTGGHGDDVIAMPYKEAPDWTVWAGVDGKRLAHAAFAEWIEDRLDDIVEPAGAALLEAVTALQLKRDVEFRSAVRLQSGAQAFAYTEADGPGTVALPASIVIGVPPFEGSPKYRLEVRIRYRLEAGKLSLWFARVRPELVQRTEREARVAAIREALNVPIFSGAVGAVGVGVRR